MASGLTAERLGVAGSSDYPGQRFIFRFSAMAYLAILRAMDTWDPLRGCASPKEAFGRISVFAGSALSASVPDWLFLNRSIRDSPIPIRAAGVEADYREMISDHGHDAFLAEQAALVRLLQ